MPDKNKKRIVISLAVLIVIAIALLLIKSSAFWQITERQRNRNIVSSACLKLTLTSETAGATVSPSEGWPLTDEKGALLQPYAFTVTNECDTVINYTIALEEIQKGSITYPNDYLKSNYVKIKLDNLAPSLFSSYNTISNDENANYQIIETKELINKNLTPHSSRVHNLRMWVDGNTPVEDADGNNGNKSFFTKIKIIAGEDIGVDACYAVNQDGLLYSYDPDCGTSAVIPDTVAGNAVKEISSNAFKASHPAFSYSRGTISEINAYYANNTCIDVDGHTESCKVDFSVALSPLLISVLSGEADMNKLTIDDLAIIVYEKLNNIKKNSLQESIGLLLGYLNISDGLTALGYTKDDIKVYYKDKDVIPDFIDEYIEYYAGIENINGTIDVKAEMGSKVPTGEVETTLSIDSLDLTKADHLQRIDSIAFSNAPDLNEYSSFHEAEQDISNLSVESQGLEYLIVDDKFESISIGAAAFAFSSLDSLILTTNAYKYQTDYEYKYGREKLEEEYHNHGDSFNFFEDYNDLYSLINDYNAFIGSVIGTITVNPSANNKVVPQGIMSGTKTIGDIVIGDGITEVADGAFGGVNPIITGSISFPNTVTKIGRRAFLNYNGVALSLPKNLTTIGDQAFQNYDGSGTVLEIPSTITSIGSNAFNDFRGTSIHIDMTEEQYQALNLSGWHGNVPVTFNN